MKVRYTIGPEQLEVAPAGHAPFSAKRGKWVEAPPEVVGRRPSGDGDLGEGLLAQFEGDQPIWELEAVKKAQRTRAANEAADSGEEG